MARKMIVGTADGEQAILTETLAENEEQLQELVKDNPELIPVEEFRMSGPVMVVGRETSLRAGRVDLVALARSGELLVVEFKTGPQNADFRAALAQLLDYGSDLWRMSYEEFERTVAVRYFHSDYCRDPRAMARPSLEEAASATWTDFSDVEMEQLREGLTRQLASGSFHYVLMAQRFTETIETTTGYLNAITPNVNFWAVELVRFTGDGMSAFESRTVLKPAAQGPRTTSERTDEFRFLGQVQESVYRKCLEDILAACRGFGMRFYWGAVGTSIRVVVPGMPAPLSIAWLFPPEKPGYMGLRDLTLGFQPTAIQNAPAVHSVLEEYLTAVQALSGIERAEASGLRAFHLSPEVTASAKDEIVEILARLAAGISGST